MHGWGKITGADGVKYYSEEGISDRVTSLLRDERTCDKIQNRRGADIFRCGGLYEWEQGEHGEHLDCIVMIACIACIITLVKDDWVSTVENCSTWFAQALAVLCDNFTLVLEASCSNFTLVHARMTTVTARLHNGMYGRVCRCVRWVRDTKDRAKQMPRGLAWTCRVTLAEKLAVNEAKTAPPKIPECPVCFEQYGDTRPARILGCGHTFCETCLAGILAPLSGCDRHHKQLPCPGCRDNTKVLRGDATTILRNFDLEALCQ